MSTTGIQNYLSNVFVPIYSYDTITKAFTPKLELSNIDNYSGNIISVFNAAIGDVNSNVYVGSNSGNSYLFPKACYNITALGYGAASNISNDSNSIYIGWYAGSGGTNSCNVISIGANSGGNGVSNIFIGTNTGTVGQSNILIGHDLSLANISDQIRIGLSNKIPIAADISKRWVGVGGVLIPTHVDTYFDVSGNTNIKGQLGINIDPAPTYTLDVNGVTHSTGGFFSSSGSVDISGMSNAIIGKMVRGNMILGAQDITTPGSNYASSLIFVSDPVGIPTVLTGASGGYITINMSSSNIIISNTNGNEHTFKWSITAFPLMP